jgi:heme-degrading monooxygenase HmoA
LTGGRDAILASRAVTSLSLRRTRMILAVSRFRVANGMGPAVTWAFRDRPHLVDRAAGFLGMEVFTDSAEPSVYYLVTRWTDAESFRRWHRSDDHRASHAGIPKGLKLDPAYTRVVVLDRLDGGAPEPVLDEVIADASGVLAHHVRGSETMALVLLDGDARIRYCNDAFAERAGVAASALAGRAIAELLTAADAEALRARLDADARTPDERFLLNVVDERGMPFTLCCRLDVQPGHAVLVGEPPQRAERRMQDELLEMNNRLAVLARENAQKSVELARVNAELAATLEELDRSYWHLRRVQEVLPICLGCNKVKTSEMGWEELADYLRAHALFLSHGFCPDCAARHLASRTEAPAPGAAR